MKCGVVDTKAKEAFLEIKALLESRGYPVIYRRYTYAAQLGDTKDFRSIKKAYFICLHRVEHRCSAQTHR